ncbi:hypothetical protein AALP_AA3G277400 [Arabis alpina]|uniref:MATH domain-containing protein n=1 Tax=Arabis alpina TaxID=50452 RepID=A0A087HC47_ARAAL|nr:hypothetical protein AALP_AA3G277400 [Arabis alpina]
MGDQRFTWVLDDFSSLQDDKCYSRPFMVADCNWRLVAYPKGYMNRAAQCFFAKNHQCWGYDDFVSLTKIHAKDEGFLVNDKLTIIAELVVFPASVVVKISEPLSTKEASDAKSQGDSSCQMEQKTENASKESSDEDHDTSEKGSHDDDDDTSDESSDDDDDDFLLSLISDDDFLPPPSDGDVLPSPVSDDGARDVETKDMFVGFRPKNQNIISVYMNEMVNFLEMMRQSSKKLSEDDMKNANDTLVDLIDAGFNFDWLRTKLNELPDLDCAVKDLPAFQSDAFVTGACKCRLTKGNLDASEKSEKVDAEPKNLLNEASSVKETMDVHGFQVLPSQVESVRRIFENHPDVATEFRGKNQHLRKACMNFLLSLIETVCQSLEELSTEDLVEADVALTYLKDAGFKVDWLEKKLEQVIEKKQKEESGLAKLKETEENLLKLKLKCAELDALAEQQKAELSATRTPLTFDDRRKRQPLLSSTEGNQASDASKESLDDDGSRQEDVDNVDPVSDDGGRIRKTCIFEKHPDVATEFRGKNQHLRKACMNFLLSLIEMLCQSLEELSIEDLVEADILERCGV